MHPPRIPRIIAHGKRKPNLRRKADHLAYIKQLPCVGCGRAAPSEAAHVRIGTDGGIGLKPSDKYVTPLCHACHDTQHAVGEITFWSAKRIDPIDTALALYRISGDIEAGNRIVFRARQRIAFS